MNYRSIYTSLVDSRAGRELDGYVERHHIVPKCLGGGNEKSNIVKLTPEEHYLAHQLLVKIHPGNQKLLYALIRMTIHPNGKRMNNKLFGWIRRKCANNHPMLNPEIVSRVSTHRKEMWKDPVYREMMSNLVIGEKNPMYGKTGAANHSYGKVAANNGLVCKKFKPDEVPEGWVLGYLSMKGETHPMYGKKHKESTRAKLASVLTKLRTCSDCGKTMSIGSMALHQKSSGHTGWTEQ